MRQPTSSMRVLKVVLALGIVLVWSVGRAEPTGTIRHIGYLGPPPTPSTEHLKNAFVDALRTHGWAEGRNLVIEQRYFEAADDRLIVKAADLVRLDQSSSSP